MPIVAVVVAFLLVETVEIMIVAFIAQVGPQPKINRHRLGEVSQRR